MRSALEGRGVPWWRARWAAPKASKWGPSGGVSNSRLGSFCWRNCWTKRFLVTPPINTTRPEVTRARVRNSAALEAMTSARLTTISSLVHSFLFSLWVQSLFMKTLQRAERGWGEVSSGMPGMADRSMFMRPSCWRKNSPVPAAHLSPIMAVWVRPSVVKV